MSNNKDDATMDSNTMASLPVAKEDVDVDDEFISSSEDDDDDNDEEFDENWLEIMLQEYSPIPQDDINQNFGESEIIKEMVRNVKEFEYSLKKGKKNLLLIIRNMKENLNLVYQQSGLDKRYHKKVKAVVQALWNKVSLFEFTMKKFHESKTDKSIVSTLITLYDPIEIEMV